MSFDTIAGHYRWLEAVLAAGILQRCRTAHLDRAKDAKRVLLLGEGNGRFLAPFLRENRSAQVVCVEESRGMISRCTESLKRLGIDFARVEFVNQDAIRWRPPAGEFDLIVTHFFLDCFTERQLQFLIPDIASSAKPGCRWLLADFQLPAGGLKRWRAVAVHKLMYAFFRVATRLPARRLASPDPHLRAAGFELTARITESADLVRSDCWSLKKRGPGDPGLAERAHSKGLMPRP